MPRSWARLVAVFLLMWMPLHALWAAAAPYCGHDNTPATASEAPLHLGHHTHAHGPHGASEVDGEHAEEGAPAQGEAAGGVGHPECHVCHACGTVMPASLAAPAPTTGVAAPEAGAPLAPPAPWPGRPERPKWWLHA